MVGSALVPLLFGALYLILKVSEGQSFPPPLSSEEERRCFRLARAGDGDARRRLIEHNLRLVVHIVKKYYTQTDCQEDLVSIGTIGLIKAVNTFVPSKGIKLATYASRCIENEILMFLRKNQNRRHELSIDETLNSDGDGNELQLSDVLGTEPDTVSRALEHAAARSMVRRAVSHLQERERLIMELRYGLGGRRAHTQKEVADIIGISQSYISRLEKRILKSLRGELDLMV